jgi:hypothetical protein
MAFQLELLIWVSFLVLGGGPLYPQGSENS